MMRSMVLLAAAACSAVASDGPFTDGLGDAVIRRTDSGCDGAINPDSTLPDVLRVTASGWRANDPVNDPYTGSIIGDGRDAELFRIDVTFAGLVNPSGTIGLGGEPFEPFRFGPSPVLGFLDFDADSDDGTGGELDGDAEIRFLANVGRFGGLPGGSIGLKAARSGAGPCGDHDLDFWSPPYFERSGAEFALVMCGCHEVTVVSKSGGDQDDTFEAGETWIVRSRYFQRAGGYRGASSVFGGSAFGLYDPFVNLRFRHDVATDTTTITLVEALTMRGAAELTGEPEQPIDSQIGGSNHHSVVEAIQDVIDNASNLSGPTQVLAGEWEGEDPEEAVRVEQWEITALFGTSYTSPQDGLYVWTDVGFEVRPCDLNADEYVDALDVGAFDAHLAAEDGGACDGDGAVDGRIVVPNCGPNFSLFDLDGDGVVDAEDRGLFCRGDLTGSSDPGDPSYGLPDGDVDADDFFYYLDQFSSGDLAEADLTGSSDPFSSDYGLPDLIIDSNDFFYYLDMFVLGCPD